MLFWYLTIHGSTGNYQYLLFACRDDPELDKMLKERVRWGDPMAHLVKVFIIHKFVNSTALFEKQVK